MDNHKNDLNQLDNGESPADLFKKIIITTVVTCLVGWLVMYFGLI